MRLVVRRHVHAVRGICMIISRVGRSGGCRCLAVCCFVDFCNLPAIVEQLESLRASNIPIITAEVVCTMSKG